MITINNIRVQNQKKRVRLIAYIQLSENSVATWEKKAGLIDRRIVGRYQRNFLDENYGFDMWFEVPIEFEKSLCYERSDAFLVASLYFAMITGEDIMCESPVTEKLLYQLERNLIPVLCDNIVYPQIRILAPVAKECEKIAFYTGTGISCGVDSFATVLSHLDVNTPSSFRLTHLTLFNTGSMNFSGYKADKTLAMWREETFEEFQERIAVGKRVSDELNLNFLDIDSNIPDLYQGAFLYSHTYRNCAAVLATQKMWRYYFYSSAGEGIQCNIGLNKGAAEYDLLTLAAISLEKLHFLSAGLNYKRMQKIAMIADNSIVRKYINVCTLETYNCGKCVKCIRTLLALDLMGKLDDFKDSFKDMSYYFRYKWKFMGDIMEAKPDKHFAYDMKKYVESKKMDYGIKSKIYHYMWPIRKIRNVYRKRN